MFVGFVGFVGHRGMSLSINEVFQGSSKVFVGGFFRGAYSGVYDRLGFRIFRGPVASVFVRIFKMKSKGVYPQFPFHLPFSFTLHPSGYISP